MLLRTAKLHYPVTITRLHVSSGKDVEKTAPLFEYNYKSRVEEVDEFGEAQTVEHNFRADFVAPVDGQISSWKVQVGTVLRHDGEPLVELEEPCLHEVQFAGMCANCGKDMTEVDFANPQQLTDRANINIAHGSTQLRVSANEASRISDESRRRLLTSRKLSLVVDLDQTIIHATVDPTVAEWQKDPENPNYEAVKDVRAFQLIDEGPGARGCWYYIKLRPGLLQFLEEISKYYELHIYTMGTRAYALNIAKIVDPDRKIFADRIISRDENGSMLVKNLHRLFPVDTQMVVIIDDRGDVWQWSANLIKVPQYDFFVGIGDINSSFLPKKETLQREAKVVQAKKDAESANKVPPEDDEASPEAEMIGDSGVGDIGEAEAISAIEQQLVAMAGGDDPSLLEKQSTEQETTIAAQLEDRPLLKMQEKIDKFDEEVAKATTNGEAGDELADSQTRHHLLRDDDEELEHLERSLKRVHKIFYDEYERKLAGSTGGRVAELRGERGVKRKASDELFAVPDIKDIMPSMKQVVLKDVVIVFSGVVPLTVDVQVSDLALWAKSFGARIETNINSATTHVVATRQRKTHKVKMAANNPKIKIVTVDWLIEAFSTWQKPDEAPHKIEVEPEENGMSGLANDEKDLLSVLEQPDQYLSGTDEEDGETEADGTEISRDYERFDADADADADEEQQQQSPISDISPMDWGDMNDELDEFLGDDDDSDHSDASNDSHASSRSAASRNSHRKRTKKRKRGDSSAENSDNEGSGVQDGERAALKGQGSDLQRRRKKAFERVTSLTNVASADKLGDVDISNSGITAPGGQGVGPVVTGASVEEEEDEDDDDLGAELERGFEDAQTDDDGD